MRSHSSLPSSVTFESTARSPHVFADPSKTGSAPSTVMPFEHTRHGLAVGGGQQMASASIISTHVFRRTPRDAYSSSSAQLEPPASGYGMIREAGTVSPSGHTGHGGVASASEGVSSMAWPPSSSPGAPVPSPESQVWPRAWLRVGAAAGGGVDVAERVRREDRITGTKSGRLGSHLVHHLRGLVATRDGP